MGWIAEALSVLTNAAAPSSPRAVSLVSPGSGGAAPSSSFAGFATTYQKNATVNAGLELLATSAAEPKVIGRRLRKSKSQTRTQTALWAANGISNRAGAMVLDAMLVQNGFYEELPDHPMVRLLNTPNPFMSGDDLWGSVVIDRWLAGNAFILKARSDLRNVGELWRLRPDRVKVIADSTKFISGYEYKVGQETFTFPREDVMHFKTRNPMDPYYGLPLLMPILDAIAIDGSMKAYIRSFFDKGGTGPGAILTTKGKISEDDKTEIRNRMRRLLSGPQGYHETLILDSTESTYTQLGPGRGLTDALPKEVAAMIAAEISMCLGIPASILGQLIGLESSSYANKRADWQVLWDVNLTPLMGSIQNTINMSMLNPEAPDFRGIDEVQFDLSSIRALQEDEDALQERARKNFTVGIWSFEEGRLATGMDPNPAEGMFALPAGVTLTSIDQLSGEDATGGDVQTLALNGAQIASLLEVVTAVTLGQLAPETAKAMIRVSFPSVSEADINTMVDAAAGFSPETPVVNPPDVTVEPAEAIAAHYRAEFAQIDAPRRGRPALLADPGARATFEQAEKIRIQNPSLTLAQVAARAGISERQYRRYRGEYGKVGLIHHTLDSLSGK